MFWHDKISQTPFMIFFSDCGCSNTGSTGQTCKGNGKCDCKPNYIGVKCDECRFGYFQYPECRSKYLSNPGMLKSILFKNDVRKRVATKIHIFLPP